MKVNCQKTQMTVVSPDNGCQTLAVLEVGGATINSIPAIKLLGYMIGETPGAGPQLSLMKSKFRAHFWSLVHLRNAGVKGFKLYRIYTICVRPVLEVNAVVFHPQLTREQNRALERLQNQVVRLCFGAGRPFYQAREDHDIATLEQRRVTAIEKFTERSLRNERFSKRWFKRRPEIGTSMRRRRPYEENKARTRRFYNSPLLHIQRVANTICTS